MVTAQQLKERMTVLKLRLGGNDKSLTWLVSENHEKGKLEHFSALDCVDFMTTDPTIVKTPEDTRYVQAINAFISKEGHGYYSIGTVNMGTMVCAIYLNRNAQGVLVPEIYQDERKEKIINRLTNTTSKGKPIWYQELRIIRPKILGAKYE
ncbi:hypothetical protein KY335_06075 [Candidatus Woesearchaeota archaeon]|nr:hypothetical protein [Candidatus Woesearchaeota archaeon]